MGQAARRFAVRLTSPEGDESELRLMSRPLLRYSDSDVGVIDGAIFSFVVATDPEALLLIEASEQGESPAWRYALARFHFWNLSAALDGVPVWSAAPDHVQAKHQFGDPTQFEKAYVSFHPRRAAAP
jgi:hypothetical protein